MLTRNSRFSQILTALSFILATTVAVPFEAPQDAYPAFDVRAVGKPSSGKPSGGKPASGTVTPSTSTVGKDNYDAVKHLTTKVGWHAFSIAWDKVAISNDPEM